MSLKKKKKIIDRRAEQGIVMSHESKIPLIRRKFRADMPRARPTPSTAPTMEWVVDMGIPIFEATKIVTDAAHSAEKPRVGVSCVILCPIVSITRQP